MHPQPETRVRVGSGVWPDLPVEEAIRRWAGGGSQAFRSERPSEGGLETEASAPVGEVGRSWKRAPFLLGQAFRWERPS